MVPTDHRGKTSKPPESITIWRALNPFGCVFSHKLPDIKILWEVISLFLKFNLREPVKRVNMESLVGGYLPDGEPDTAEEQTIYGHFAEIIRVRKTFTPGRCATGITVIVPIAESDDLSVLDRVNKDRKVACMGQIVKKDSSADFGRFADGIVQDQRINHRFPDTPVLLEIVNIISVAVPPIASNLDVEFIKNCVDMVVERTVRKVIPVLVQGRP